MLIKIWFADNESRLDIITGAASIERVEYFMDRGRENNVVMKVFC